MKFSLLYEMQISGPNRAAEAQLFHDCVEQVVLADQLGYHCVWEVEHHGLYEYSHSSAPEVFLSFVAARTAKIRIGHGVTLLPHRYNHPIRIAERIATLDILSGGRVNWGTGKSASEVEKHGFENDVTQLHAQWREALEMIPRMWAEDVFEFKGQFFNIPPMQVIPKPVQKPHPPIFAACTKPASVHGVAELGIGALNFALGTDDYLADKVADYRKTVAAATPVAAERTDHYAATPTCLVLDDDAEACRLGFRGDRFFNLSLARYYFAGDRPTGLLDVPREPLPEQDLADATAARHENHTGAIIGDPSFAKERVQRYADAGVDELILIMQMGTVPHEAIMRSIRTFGEKVLPHFA